MSPLEIMRERRAAKKAELDALLAAPTTEVRDLTEAESSTFDVLVEEIRKSDVRCDELAAQEVRENAAAETTKLAGTSGEQRGGGATVVDPPVYAKDKTDTFFFRDMWLASKPQQHGHVDALDRLRRNAKAEAALQTETRALGNTGAVGGSGGEFAPPAWMVADFVALARPGRVTADLFDKQPLPAGVSSVNVPRVATGTTVTIQTTQNTALSQTDLTTTSLSAGIVTIGGKQVVSLQLLEQSAIPFDRVILEDLALAYAGTIDTQALVGTGTGGTLRSLNSAAGLTAQAYTQATPAVGGAGGLYAQVAKAIAAVYSTRFLPPDTILMHPRRWAFITASFDSQGRPLVVPTAVAYNPIATDDTNMAQGPVGQLQGLTVYTDPNIPINTGVGTNQDPIYVFRRGDIKLWESAPRMETFEQPYADSMGVLFRLYAYASLIPDRYGSSIVQINGTGTVTPTF